MSRAGHRIRVPTNTSVLYFLLLLPNLQECVLRLTAEITGIENVQGISCVSHRIQDYIQHFTYRIGVLDLLSKFHNIS